MGSWLVQALQDGLDDDDAGEGEGEGVYGNSIKAQDKEDVYNGDDDDGKIYNICIVYKLYLSTHLLPYYDNTTYITAPSSPKALLVEDCCIHLSAIATCITAVKGIIYTYIAWAEAYEQEVLYTYTYVYYSLLCVHVCMCV